MHVRVEGVLSCDREMLSSWAGQILKRLCIGIGKSLLKVCSAHVYGAHVYGLCCRKNCDATCLLAQTDVDIATLHDCSKKTEHCVCICFASKPPSCRFIMYNSHLRGSSIISTINIYIPKSKYCKHK